VGVSKVKHIIIREYTTRVRKKAFIIMTLLGPLLFAALMVVPVWISQLEEKEEKEILIVEFDRIGNPVPDSLMILKNVFKDKPLLNFHYLGDLSEKQAKAIFTNSNYYGMLFARHNVLFSGEKVSVKFYTKKHPPQGIKYHIKKSLEDFLLDIKLISYKVPPNVLGTLKSKVELEIQRVGKEGFKGTENIEKKRAVGYISGFLIYIFIFFFGAQVMRGVAEEKSNRIVEVIVTSVKPFQLMIGKIAGIGLVGLTQFFVWIILSFFIFHFTESFLIEKNLKSLQNEQQVTELFQKTVPLNQDAQQHAAGETEINELIDGFRDINFAYILTFFIFYFICGYLLYASMFAAIGAAVDNETDTQQFMLPVTIPLVISIVVMMNAISNPDGDIAFWFSIIPFTSPIVMMARIGFDVPIYQLALSAMLLIISFVLMTWIAAKIYRTGILMYGKKLNYKELWKWLKY